MTSQAPQIQVKGLWKVFGDKPERALQPEYAARSRDEIQEELGLVVGLRDVSFDVDRGEIFVVMGLSGSGKSTLVRCLIRLIDATQGQIYFDGEDILTYPPDGLIEFRRQKVAMVFQHYGLLPNRCVIDNVCLGLEIQGVDKRTRYAMASEAIETVGLKGMGELLPQRDERRDAAARWTCEGAGGKSGRAAYGRAVQRPRSAYPERDAGRAYLA